MVTVERSKKLQQNQPHLLTTDTAAAAEPSIGSDNEDKCVQTTSVGRRRPDRHDGYIARSSYYIHRVEQSHFAGILITYGWQIMGHWTPMRGIIKIFFFRKA